MESQPDSLKHTLEPELRTTLAGLPSSNIGINGIVQRSVQDFVELRDASLKRHIFKKDPLLELKETRFKGLKQRGLRHSIDFSTL